MSKSIKIDDVTYEAVAKFAQQEDRPLSNALARLVKLGLTNLSEQLSVSEQTVPTSLDSVEKAMREMEADRKRNNKKLTLDNLTDKDLATAKVTFEERPDFKGPEKWDSHAWPTV